MTQAVADLTTRASRANLDNTLYGDLDGEPLWDALDSCAWDAEQEMERTRPTYRKRIRQMMPRRRAKS